MGEDEVHLLLIGGGSGTGKSSVGYEVSVVLQEHGVAHCLVEGDALDHVHPAPRDDPDRSALTERNLAAIWRNDAALGYRRIIYTNTASLLSAEMLRRAVGASLETTVGVLLTASDASVAERLRVRESGSRLAWHLDRSRVMRARLDVEAPSGTVRIATDGRSVRSIALDVLRASGWATGGPTMDRCP